MNKHDMRAYIKEKRNNLNLPDINHNSAIITEKLLELELYKISSIIFIYMDIKGEVITHNIIHDAWNKGKKVAVPKIINKSMEFYYINSFQELKPGYYNIREPITNNIAKANEALVIMPGVAFDIYMNRLGYGAGYYDRYLKDKVSFYKVALAYEFQVINYIEHEKHDIKVDCIITESNIYK